MKRHVLLASVRMTLAIGVAFALPYSHLEWGEHYPGDGQKAVGFILIFWAIGLGAAFCFVALGSLAQFLLRHLAALYTVLADVALFAVFGGALAYAGVSAKYGEVTGSANESGDARQLCSLALL